MTNGTSPVEMRLEELKRALGAGADFAIQGTGQLLQNNPLGNYMQSAMDPRGNFQRGGLLGAGGVVRGPLEAAVGGMESHLGNLGAMVDPLLFGQGAAAAGPAQSPGGIPSGTPRTPGGAGDLGAVLGPSAASQGTPGAVMGRLTMAMPPLPGVPSAPQIEPADWQRARDALAGGAPEKIDGPSKWERVSRILGGAAAGSIDRGGINRRPQSMSEMLAGMAAGSSAVAGQLQDEDRARAERYQVRSQQYAQAAAALEQAAVQQGQYDQRTNAELEMRADEMRFQRDMADYAAKVPKYQRNPDGTVDVAWVDDAGQMHVEQRMWDQELYAMSRAAMLLGLYAQRAGAMPPMEVIMDGKVLGIEDPTLKARAAMAVQALNSPEHREVLIEALREEDPTFKFSADPAKLLEYAMQVMSPELAQSIADEGS